MSTVDFTELFKFLLEKEVSRDDSFLTQDDVDELLLDAVDSNDDSPRQSILGYPTHPLCVDIGTMLTLWHQTRECPILSLPTYDMLDEKSYVAERLKTVGGIMPQIKQLASLWNDWSKDEQISALRDIILNLGGKRGLLDILGMRKTIGTSDLWPPPRKILENTFLNKHKPESESILTVGARALAKHSHRDESTSWWGLCTGSEKAKNEHAEGIMDKILNDAHWINIHQLPHDVKIIEVRQSQGYGLRWSCDGLQFRGFLEPQMVGGHEVGWKH